MWRDVYGLLATGLGIGPDEVAEMDWERATRLIAYWGEWPPVHVIARALAGVKGASPGSTSLDDVREIAGKIGGP